MDRLVCGDVGYGKTEVAMRAAFKAVADKKQVAVLVPTTLLADQHYRTFSARFGGFPLRDRRAVALSRAKPSSGASCANSPKGKVDIVVGTHRLLQKDVAFADLGLIVIDEEQRFGVMHKERLKEYRASVDALTLSATPIPRTLHMSLLGVRDLSLIQTPPKNRMAIKTLVVPAGDAVVQHAIAAELDRGGQVYYLHNRIESIYAVPNALAKARAARAHRRRSRTDGRDRDRAGDASLHRRRTRRVGRHDDHRERHRHSQRQHDDRQRRRQVRPGAALSTARTRRSLEPPGVLLPSLSGAQGAYRGGESASRSDSRVHASRVGIADRDARSRDSRSRQSARCGAVGLHRVGRIRYLLRAARRSDRGASRDDGRARGPARGRHRREDQRVHSERVHPASLAKDRRLPTTRQGPHARPRSRRSPPACATASGPSPCRWST